MKIIVLLIILVVIVTGCGWGSVGVWGGDIEQRDICVEIEGNDGEVFRATNVDSVRMYETWGDMKVKAIVVKEEDKGMKKKTKICDIKRFSITQHDRKK